MRFTAKGCIASRLETNPEPGVGRKIIVVHNDAVVRADVLDALQAVRPDLATLAFADLTHLTDHLLAAEPADLLLFDAQLQVPQPVLSRFRWSVPMLFNPTGDEAPAPAFGAARTLLPIPIRDEAVTALLDGLFGSCPRLIT
jgi:hypothetical protein